MEMAAANAAAPNINQLLLPIIPSS
jgi:hypothetical protein